MQAKLYYIWLTLGLVALGACSKAPEPGPPSEPSPLMQPITLEDWELQLGDYPPDILVVDYWASWCAPCLQRFPHMAELANRYADRGVTFLSFNLDDPGDPIALDMAEDFLQTMQASFDPLRMEHLRIETPPLEAMAWFGLQSIPAVSFYDRTGIEAVRLTGEDAGELFDEADVEAAIEQLVSAQQPI